MSLDGVDDCELVQPDQSARVSTWRTKTLLIVLVVLFGCANNISKQIAAKPLTRYTYVLGLLNVVVYIPVYGGSLWGLLRSGTIPRWQWDFVWKRASDAGRLFSVWWFFALAAAGDSLGDVVGMICTPYVSGPIHSLTSNCTPIFIAVLSMLFLRRRYSLLQCTSLLAVCIAVVIGVLPSFERGQHSSSDPFFTTILGLSCIFNAISFVVKEFLFARYDKWLSRAGHDDDGRGLHVFIVSFHTALFQLPFTICTVPLNTALGQTHGQSIFQYIHDAFACVFSGGHGSACGPDSEGADYAGTCTVVYIVFNILWNVAILASVKISGALATFVALKAVFPVSTLLFAYVDWPLLGQTELNWLVWLSVAIMVPSVVVYQVASANQDRRARSHEALATCCWPFRVEISRSGVSVAWTS